mgnify:CR=1 FL=1
MEPVLFALSHSDTMKHRIIEEAFIDLTTLLLEDPGTSDCLVPPLLGFPAPLLPCLAHWWSQAMGYAPSITCPQEPLATAERSRVEQMVGPGAPRSSGAFWAWPQTGVCGGKNIQQQWCLIANNKLIGVKYVCSHKNLAPFYYWLLGQKAGRKSHTVIG